MTVTLNEMTKAGMHLGHEVRKWNPKMKPFIHSQKDNIHIIDLVQTYFLLKQTSQFLTKSTAQGQTVLFVGTKKPVSSLLAKAAINCDSFYVNQKWLGGLLTNWQTIQLSIKKLKELETRFDNGLFEKIPKKEASSLLKEKEKLDKYLGGLKTMQKIPDIVIIIGQTHEINAVKECQKLQIRTITLLDTDCNPALADFGIPANDDSIPSLQLLLNEFVEAIQKGKILLNSKGKN